MLIQKKIEKGRLLIYVSVIILMIGGAIFFIYKNYSMGNSGGEVILDVPAVSESAETSDYDADNLSGNVPGAAEGASGPGAENMISPAAAGEEVSSLIDLSLLSQTKFKMLKENTLKLEELETGRTNPFAPY